MTDYIENREEDGSSKRGGYNLKRDIPQIDFARDWRRITDHRGNTVGYFRNEDLIHDLEGEGLAGTDDWSASNAAANPPRDFMTADLGSKVYGYIDGSGGSLSPNMLPDGTTIIHSISAESKLLEVTFGPTGTLQPKHSEEIVLELQTVPALSIPLTWDTAKNAYIATVKEIGNTFKALIGTPIQAQITVSPLIITADTTKFKADSSLKI